MNKRPKKPIQHKNGNRIYFDAKLKSWRYTDDGGDAFIPRACPNCKLFQHDDGRDACMPHMTGVTASCCGHGITKGFIEFEDGSRKEGTFASEPEKIQGYEKLKEGQGRYT